MKQPEPFGKFVLLGQVAVGGMAEIYKGRYADPSAPQFDIAVKRILPSYTEDEGFVTMFKDEGTIALRLSHPNIVKVYEVGEVNHDWFIAMEFIHGTDLRVLSDACEKYGKRFTCTQIARIVCETAKALDYAHTCSDANGTPLNIVHRDCTPHNIMVTYDGRVKLMDFGIAKAASRATKTRVGTVKGKSSYMSPEQARGKALDGRSDMFTLGTVAWEMLTSYRLFKANSDFDILSKVLKSEIIHPSDIDANIPRPLGDIIMRTLQRDRDQRFMTCGQLADALEAFIRDHGDGSDQRLGETVAALAGRQGRSANELPSYTPAESLYKLDDRGEFVMIAGAGPRRTLAYSPAEAAPMPQEPVAPPPSMAPVPQPFTQPAPVFPGDPMAMAASVQHHDKPWGFIIGTIITLMIGVGFGVFGFIFFTKQPDPVPAFVAPEASLALKSLPSGANITINGEQLPSQTPYYASNFKIGEKVQVTFELSGHEPLTVERQLLLLSQDISVNLRTLEAARAAELNAIPTLTIKTDPPGAIVEVNGERLGPSPVTINNVAFGTELKIDVIPADSAFAPANQVFVAANGADPEMTIALSRAVRAQAQPPPTQPRTTPPRQPRQPREPRAETGFGTLTVKATPWAVVSIDGTRIGNSGTAPLTNRSMASGTHRIDLTFPSKNKRVTKTVTIKPNQHVEVNYDFNADKWL
ncbi:MAG: protein kinase [Proteobacteria bacterium]|nr:protein kinase [Pseudomonadota bacterium]